MVGIIAIAAVSLLAQCTR